MQRFTSKEHRAPVITKLRAQRLVQLDRLRVPVEHLHVYPVTLLLDRDARDLCQEGRPHTLLAKFLSHEQIFQKQSAPDPCRKIVEEHSIARGLSVPFRNQCAKTRILTKTIAGKILFSNSHPFELPLVLREFANHGTQQ